MLSGFFSFMSAMARLGSQVGLRWLVFVAVLQAASFAISAHAAQVTDPILSPTYDRELDMISIKVTDATPGAVLHYTTDNSTPDESSATVASGERILIKKDQAITVRAHHSGDSPSNFVVGHRSKKFLTTAQGPRSVFLMRKIAAISANTATPAVQAIAMDADTPVVPAVAVCPPVNITISKKGSAPPTTGTEGIIVQNGGTLSFSLTGSGQTPSLIAPGQPVWYTRQLKQCAPTPGDTNTDDYFTAWQPMGATCTGTGFDYTPTTSGIFQVEVVFFGDTNNAVHYMRHYDTPSNYITDSLGNVATIYAKGQPDYFGVVDSAWQIAVRNFALSNLGSTAYAQSAALPAYAGRSAVPANHNKCNVFVYDQAEHASLPVPVTWSLLHFVYYPPSAHQWWDASFSIAKWTRLSTSTNPQPGFITAGPEGTHGHAGVVDYDGAWINAGRNTVNKYPHVTFCTDDPYKSAACRQYTP